MGQELCPGIFWPSSSVTSCTSFWGKGAMACPLQGICASCTRLGLLPRGSAVAAEFPCLLFGSMLLASLSREDIITCGCNTYTCSLWS